MSKRLHTQSIGAFSHFSLFEPNLCGYLDYSSRMEQIIYFYNFQFQQPVRPANVLQQVQTDGINLKPGQMFIILPDRGTI